VTYPYTTSLVAIVFILLHKGDYSHEKNHPKGEGHRNLKIAVVCIGGGGMNTFHELQSIDVPVEKFIAIDRDKESLARSRLSIKIELDAIKNDPEIIVHAAKQQEVLIRKMLRGVDVIVLVVGMGGLTGTHTSPEIAIFARKMGIQVWAIVTMPFGFEGNRRAQTAKEGIANLQKNTDGLLCLSNQQLIEDCSSKSVSMLEAFRLADEGIAHVLGMLSEGMDDPDQILDQLPNIWSVYKAFKFRTSCRSVSEPIDVACSFCGRHNSDVEKMLGGASAAICDECVEMCAEIMTEECGDFELCVEEDEYDGET